MTEAFECDRCGELYGEPPEVRVATNLKEETGGKVVLKRKNSTPSSTVGAPLNRQLGTESTNTTYEITRGDLCEGCADDFREFWGGGGE